MVRRRPRHGRRRGARRAASSQDLPLYGIPVGVKDIINTRGIPTRMGSRIFQNNVPSHSAWVVRRLEALGGLVMGKTVTTEFAFRHPGKTRNPWNPAHTPGGSSSGSAAAVAAGFVPVAIGTQTLGSVIRPAAFCGVVGYKPSFGAISRTGILPFSADARHRRRASRARWPTRPGSAPASWGSDARDEATVVRGAACTRCACRSSRSAHAPRLAVVRTPKWSLASRGAARALRRVRGGARRGRRAGEGSDAAEGSSTRRGTT